MFERLRPAASAASHYKAARQLVARLPELALMAGLEGLHDVLAEGLAGSPDGASARRLLALLAPPAQALAERGMAELSAQADNRARRDLTGLRLARLADQLAQAAYVEAVRESEALNQRQGKLADLAQLSGLYAQWLGLACTARALLDPQAAGLDWQGINRLFLALVRHGLLSAIPAQAESAPAQALAYLLLASDAFAQLHDPAEVAPAARVCAALAPAVWLAADFHRITPLVLKPDEGEAARRVGWDGNGQGQLVLCFGFDDCRAGLAAQQPELPAALHQRLQAAWFDRPGRAPRPAVARLGSVQAAFDFMRIRGLLGQKQRHQPSQDPFLHRAELIDADEVGVALRVTAEVAAQAGGGLLALSFSSYGWRLAAITRCQADGISDIFLAARWLGEKAEPLRLELAGQTRQGLYLAPASNNAYQAALLFDTGLPPGQRSVLADVGDGEQKLRLGAMERLGKRLLRYPITGRKSP